MGLGILYSVLFVFTFSKAAVFIAVIQIGIFLLSSRRRFYAVPAGILLPVLLFFSSVVFMLADKNPWVYEHVKKSSLVSRMEYVRETTGIIKDMKLSRVLIGNGLDTFYDLSHRYQTEPGLWSASSHNFFVQFFIENGAIAWVILILYITRSIRSNWAIWTMSERISIISLLVFSMGATIDMRVFPVYFFFFLLLGKKRRLLYEKRRVSYNTPIFLIYAVMAVFTFLFWAKYGMVFRTVIQGTITVDDLALFPYEPAFWKLYLSSSSTQADGINRAKVLLEKNAPSDTELTQSLIAALYEKRAYCDALEASKRYLIHVPYDLEMQALLLRSANNCRDDDWGDYGDFFGTLKTKLPSNNDTLHLLRPLFHFASLYYLEQGNPAEYAYWADRAWNHTFNNMHTTWQEQIFANAELAFSPDGPFQITMSMENTNASGLWLIGKLPDTGMPWWSGKKALFGITEDHQGFYIVGYDGKSDKSVEIFIAPIPAGTDTFVLTFEENGTGIIVADGAGKKIGDVDLKKREDKRFKDGLFPENKVYVGYGLAPHGFLHIKKFTVSL